MLSQVQMKIRWHTAPSYCQSSMLVTSAMITKHKLVLCSGVNFTYLLVEMGGRWTIFGERSVGGGV